MICAPSIRALGREGHEEHNQPAPSEWRVGNRKPLAPTGDWFVLDPTEWHNFATKYEKQSDGSLLGGGDVQAGRRDACVGGCAAAEHHRLSAGGARRIRICHTAGQA